MFNQVTLDRVSQTFRVLDTDAAVSGSVGLNLYDVALVAGDAGDQIIQLLLSIWGQDSLGAVKSNINFIDLLVLIDAAHLSVELIDMSGSALRRRICALGLSAGGSGRLVCSVSGRLSLDRKSTRLNSSHLGIS